jgi:hypothetical protein
MSFFFAATAFSLCVSDNTEFLHQIDDENVQAFVTFSHCVMIFLCAYSLEELRLLDFFSLFYVRVSNFLS